MPYKFQLEKYSGSKSRFTCPSCDRIKSFTRYVNIETKDYISDDVGICNRKIKCGYHKPPREYFEQNNITNINMKTPLNNLETIKPINTIPLGELEKSLSNTSSNNFIDILSNNFKKKSVDKAVELYKIGTSNYWKSSTIFWQIDKKNKIRTGKIMLYDLKTGKRVKEPRSYINWYHNIYKKELNLTEYNLQQCLFGEHILDKNTCNDIAIVESEKTAIICSIYFPNITWLASGGLTNMTQQKLECVRNMNVTLFPDNGAFDRWKRVADNFGFNISSLMERKGSLGRDLADYLMIENNNYNEHGIQ